MLCSNLRRAIRKQQNNRRIKTEIRKKHRCSFTEKPNILKVIVSISDKNLGAYIYRRKRVYRLIILISVLEKEKGIMIVLLHKLAAFFLLLGCASAQTYKINIRDGSKICTQWIAPVNGQFSATYTHQPECTGSLFWEQANGQARICCQGMATTTSSSSFPKECGKQKYAPLKTRIIGGNVANANSWVSGYFVRQLHSNSSSFSS